MSVVDRAAWARFLEQFPAVHILQTPSWGDLKEGFGWSVERVIGEGTGAQILFRRLPLRFSIAYIPKGPVGKEWRALWPQIDRLCRQKRAVFLKVEPDGWMDDSPWARDQMPGFLHQGKSVQPRRTIVIDLDGSETDWLERMKPKTRYNIRLAQKKDVVVRSSGDLDLFFALMQATGERDGFGVHSLAYYRRAFDVFHSSGNVAILLAEFAGQPLAALMVFAQGSRAWYFYGASNNLERSRMPAYILQWEAMRWAAQRGCRTYDLWGVPDEEEETLEKNFEARGDGLWGVYRFKRGFGGRLMRALPALEKVYIPSLYALFLRLYGRKDE
jgi:lipid II:glycine glycyltransferase (peptidoglycan interpeptide bridge formation enzyme)